MLLEMAADGLGERVAVGSRPGGTSFLQLLEKSRRVGEWLAGQPGERVGLVDVNSPAVPIALFGAAIAGKPFVPMSYRLADDRLRATLARAAPAVVIVGDGVAERVGDIAGIHPVHRRQLLDLAASDLGDPPAWVPDPEGVAVLLFTSGTTGEPKAAVLRHRHLVSYVLSTVEFMGAGPEEAALVSVPPYHVAGISAVLSSIYAGRRVVHLEAFEPDAWVRAAHREGITHAMVVPTMLNRILDVIDREGSGLPALRHLSYGGGRMPAPVIERAMSRLPDVDFVNAYGLTETSSTIAVLDANDHRVAFASDDADVRRRLGSVGRPLPTLELEIRATDGGRAPVGTSGEIRVRGEQVSGEYLGEHTGLDDGWFATKDAGHLDADGFLFVDGRIDDVIVRGGENLSPGEIEEVLLRHPAVAEAGVVGLPDTEWGEQVAAVVVLNDRGRPSATELQDWVRTRLRSARVPARVEFRAELPYTETGKLLRRVLRDELSRGEVSRGES
jgi:acyl-CoA synthetase (AMP-forming)/AMP-acid ligase II